MSLPAQAIIICTLLSDQLSKFFILHNFPLGTSIPVVRNILYITVVYNSGAAFGIFKNQTLFFSAVSVAAIIAVFAMLRKTESLSSRGVGFALIVGGALGNLVDRVRLGYVVDFLDFRIWPVFNIADSAITAGTVLIIFSLVVCRRQRI